MTDRKHRHQNQYLLSSGVHWFVVAVALIATGVAWQLALHSVRERTQIRFDLQVDYAISLFERQMDRYGDLLKAGVGFVVGKNAAVLPGEWHRFAQQIQLKEQYPTINGMGVVNRVPIEALPEFVRQQRLIRPEFTIYPQVLPVPNQTRQYVMPLTLIAPEELEAQATGLDVAREERRRDAIERTIRTGNVQITAPVTPVGMDTPGFIIVAPIFTTASPATEAQRRSEFVGAVVAAIDTSKLATSPIETSMRQVAIRVSDDTEIIYDEIGAAGANQKPELSASRTVSLLGRSWRFDVHSTRAFHQLQKSSVPTLVLTSGLVIDVLLFLVFVYMSRINRQTASFASTVSRMYDDQSEHLRKTNETLEQRNYQLESFSYLVSHDLKAPLTGIGFLVDCIEEDMETDKHHCGGTLPGDVADQLRLIRKQTDLAQGLIKGVMQYSGLSAEKEAPEEVDVTELLNSLRAMLTVDAAQLVMIGTFPTFHTYQTQLMQVLMNLISNGYKYHHGEGQAVVTVGMAISPLADFYRFTVADNGPGIEAAYHEKIFEPFMTLQPKDHSMSSGVGLAIVKQLISQHGGDIEIVSDMGRGTCFSFDWPCSVADESLDLAIAA